MKFTKNRLLSLLLVLAMLFALATTAFAEGGSGSESSFNAYFTQPRMPGAESVSVPSKSNKRY